ncbi:putative R3H domain, SUZ domain, R3H domain superfamily protein [Helianthus debilis subsp. tardiflorus]
MSLTQFSMVEELAYLVKDNLPCKHLVLSMEDMLVHFLQNETSLNGVLELEPMNPYNRLLLHRLADIFGFSHQSIGEGDDRHIVLKRCEDTSIPSILVADLLWEHESPTTSQLLTRPEDGSTGTNLETLTARVSLEDRESAYLAARNRIFSTGNDDDMESLRPRNNPVVARRMIAHALGQRIKQSNDGIRIKPRDHVKNQSNSQKSTGQQQQLTRKLETEASRIVGVRKHDTNVPKHEEHFGAAKRIFANALRMHPAFLSKTDKS